MLLEAQLVEGAGAHHDAEEVVVAAEEDVEPHLDVVAVVVLPAAHLTADERPELEDLHLVTHPEVHRCNHASEACTDDANLQL